MKPHSNGAEFLFGLYPKTFEAQAIELLTGTVNRTVSYVWFRFGDIFDYFHYIF